MVFSANIQDRDLIFFCIDFYKCILYKKKIVRRYVGQASIGIDVII